MINCKEISNKYKNELKEYIKSNKLNIGLAVIQVGNDPASNSYIKGKRTDCEEVGIKFRHIHYDDAVETNEIIEMIESLNTNDDISGIIVQLPLPRHLNQDKILNSIADEKDVDGFKSYSKFVSCTPGGIMMILKYINIDVDGKVCCVIGRGHVGRPMVDLLTRHNATVIWCNSHTNSSTLKHMIESSDIIISATGKAGLINNVPSGKIVIDVGISRGEDGKLYGDVAKDCYNDTALITPVPGGVGLMTRVALLKNVVMAAENLLTNM